MLRNLLKAFAAVTVLLCLCTQGCGAQPLALENVTTLSLAVFVSAINDTGSIVGGSDVGRPFVEGVNWALEIINGDPDMIPGYHLEAHFSDSQCTAGPSVRRFIDQIMDEDNTRIMIIGADCSTASEPIAELAPFWNLVQISPLSTSPILSRNSTYPTFIRMVSSDVSAAEGVVKLMLRFNWTRVAVLTQQENIFTSTFARLRDDLAAASITNNPREFNFNTNEDPTSVLYRLGNSSSRIILLNMYPSYCQEILCEASRLELTQKNGYLWLVHAWYPPFWWRAEPAERSRYTPVRCSTKEIEQMIEYNILVDHFASVDELEDRQTPTDSSLTPEEYDDRIVERLGPENAFVTIPHSHFYFDSVWAAGLALHAVVESGRYDLSKFSYDPNDTVSLDIRGAIFNAVRDLEFTGVTGPIKFDVLGDRLPTLRYFQYRREGVDGNITRYLVRNLSGSIFPFGVPQDERFVYVSIALLGFYTVFACVGVAIALLCLGLNLYFRKRKVIKLSSPYLNILIVSGIVLFYLDVILFGIDEGTAAQSFVESLCMIRLWIASIAFSLVFGTIFAKTWRVYYVFYSSNRHKRNKKTIIQDWVLLMMVGVLVAIDIVFMIAVTAVPSARLTLTNTEFQSNSQDLPTVVGLCRAEDRLIWLSVLFTYKGILLVVGMFLAFETRNVKIRHLNDSKLIGMSVYGIVVLSVALAAVGILLEGYVDTFYAVVGLMVMLGNTSLLGLIFIPKFYNLWKDPDGVNVMSSGGSGESTRANVDTKETIAHLNQEIKRLRLQLNSTNMSMASLRSTDITEESVKLVDRVPNHSPPPKPRSERAVSFSEMVTNHHDISASNEEMAEVTISFQRTEEEDETQQ